MVLRVVAARHHEKADLLERLRLEAHVAGFARELEAPFEERLRLRIVALPERREAERVVRLREDGRAYALRDLQRLGQPAPALGHQAADAPEAHQGSGEPQPELDLPGLDRPGEPGADVVALLVETLEPDGLPRPDQLGRGGLGKLDIAVEMTVACVLELAALGKPLERVLANRLEHLEPRLALGALGLADEPVVDERGDAVQHLTELEPERGPATVSAVSSEAPPTKTPRRAKSALPLSSSRL